MALELDDDEDMKFSAGASSYKENEADGSHLLPPREREFREFLVDSKAAEEIVRLLVGLAETQGELPENPVANWRAMYDAERDAFKGKENLLGPLHGPTLVTGRREENIPALLDENDALREREAKLSAELHEAVSQIHANEAAAAQVVLDAWMYGGAFVFTGPDAGLDVGKLYAAVSTTLSAKFPAPPDGPAEWAAEGAGPPKGSASIEGLQAWAHDVFAYGSPALPGGADLLTLGKCVTGECEIDVEIAKGLCLACVALSQYIVPGSELYEEPPPPDPKGKKK